MKRYKDCNRVVKIYRWLKYKPYYFIACRIRLIKHKGQDYEIDLIKKIYQGLAEVKMNNCVTMREAIENLKKRVG